MIEVQEFLKTNTWLAIVLKVCTIAFCTYIVAHILKKVYQKSDKQSLYKKFIYNIIVAVVYLTGLLFIIGQVPQLNKVTQTILAGSGIMALAISLSAQESLNNIISGMFITLFKPFEVGDRITLVNSNITGTIEDITLRHTIIRTFTNSRIIVPNSNINKDIIENSNLIDSRASSFIDVCVSYECDIEKAMDIMAEIMYSHPKFIDTREDKEEPLVRVYVRELGESGVWLRGSMWTETVGDNFQACSDVRLQIKKEFEANNIEIPYNKLVIANLHKS